MMTSLPRRAALALAGAAVPALILLPAAPAAAHPLGRFSVNQYVGLSLHPDRIDARAVLDIAEIPSLQDRPSLDTDSDDTVSPDERSRRADAVCADVAAGVTLRMDGHAVAWTARPGELSLAAGAGGLDVTRVTCGLTAAVDLTRPAVVSIHNGYLADRVGWREMTAAGSGVRLVGSPLPVASVSDELRAYPDDLLESTLDVRAATVRVAPGGGSDRAAGPATGAPASDGDAVTRGLAALERRFADLAGTGDLTPLVGGLAVGLALLLGAGHALLPGHGKTVLAAYLAGRRGRRRDALVVAGTVTLTHTGGVIALGLALAAGSVVAGDALIGWLGVVTGLVVTTVGVTMLAAAVRRHHSGLAHDHHGHEHHGHDHHDHGHRPHDHGRRRWSDRLGLAGIGLAGGLVPSPSALVVLLAAIGLGRTGFGIALVVAYGVGMAATLTGAGLLLLAVTDRVARADWRGRLPSRLVVRVQRAAPTATAVLVLLVGVGLATRAAGGVLVAM
jgi:ABC-type nickel/cobalt efflux system permease component RcnA